MIIVIIIYLGNSPPVWSPRTLCRVRRSPPLGPNPSQMNPLISLISVLPTKILYASTLSLVYDMRCASPVISFSHPETPRPVLRPTQASCSVRSGILSREWSGWGMLVTIHVQLLLRLRMRGAIPLLPLCSFVAWTGKTNFCCYPILNKITQDSLALFVL